MIKNTGLKYGLIGAIVLVAWILGLYFVDKHLISSAFYTYWAPLLLLFPLFMYKAAVEEYKIAGSKDFRQSLRTPFLAFVVANVFLWLCLYGLHLYDPELSRIELTKLLEFKEGQLQQGMGDPQEMNKIREEVNGILTELKHPSPPAGPYILWMAFWMIPGFGLAAAITAIVRSTRR